MTPTRFTIKSAAKAGSRSYSPSAQRCSIVTSRPSLMPASIKPCPKAAVRCDGSGRPSCKNPIAGGTGCARAASGHVVAPLRSAMASRRLMKVAMRPSGEGSCPIEYGDYITPRPGMWHRRNMAQPDESSDCFAVRSPRHNRGRLDLDPRRLLDQPHNLDQRHREIMRAENIAIDLSDRLQFLHIFSL